MEVRLENPIKIKPDNKPPSDRCRPFQQVKDLPHFHGHMSEADAAEALTNNGDYLLREDPQKRGVYWLSVRGARGNYLHHRVSTTL